MPLALASFIFYAGYKYLSIKSSYKTWHKKVTALANVRNTIPFIELRSEFNEFLNICKSYHLPETSVNNLNSIASNLEDLMKKANADSWANDVRTQPPEIHLISDITYKHVPDLVIEFIQIPDSMKNKKSVHNNKSAVDLLNENTKILALSCQEITEHLFDDNVRKMAIQQVHFKNKFAQNMSSSDK